jgi:hypothetical protein
MISRDEIRHLCLEHDRFMAEARESLRRSLHYDNGAQAAVPVPEPEPFDAAQSDVLARLVALVQDGEQAEREKALAERDARITRLDGKVEALLALLGKSVNLPDLKSADVIDVPNWRKRDVA